MIIVITTTIKVLIIMIMITALHPLKTYGQIF